MDKQRIPPIVVRYLLENADSLEGTMPFDRAYLINGRKIHKRERDPQKVVLGKVHYVLADLLEKREFFGYGLSELQENVHNPRNAKIKPLTALELPELRDSRPELFIPGRTIVEPKDYLDILENPTKFMELASGLGGFYKSPTRSIEILFGWNGSVH